MSLRILNFSLLFIVPTWAAGRDCDDSDGYIRDHRDNVTENCDQECGWLQCGDVCINAVAGYLCICGTERLTIYSGNYYCCVDHSPDNRKQCSVDSDGNGYCPWGRLVLKEDTCNNHCFNDYETSAAVGENSHYHCGDHKCVEAQFMCRGYPQCPDSRDVSECDEDLKCVLGPHYSHNKSVLVVSNLSSGHYYCDYDILHNDGQYDTITREDEADLNISSRKVQINYTSITECNTAGQFNLPGLMCGEHCVEHRFWCQEVFGASCGKYNFSTDNKQLCANATFWAGKSCDRLNNDGEKAALGRRCNGAAQHCIYPWYSSSISVYEVSHISYHNIIFSIPCPNRSQGRTLSPDQV